MARESFGFGGSSSSSSGSSSSSNIRVSVRWYEQAVFAGDEIRCRITFTNATPKQQPQPQPQPQQAPSQPSRPPSASSRRLPGSSAPPSATTTTAAASSSLAPPAPPLGRGHHRASHSISGPAPSSSAGYLTSSSSSSSISAARQHATDSTPWAPSNGTFNDNAASNNGNGGAGKGHNKNHRRSLSIVSISTDAQAGPSSGSAQLPPGTAAPQHRPMRGHSRASSLQIGRDIGRGSSIFSGPRSATNPSRSFASQPSPLFNSSFPPSERGSNITGLRGRLTGSATVPNTPSIGSMSRDSPRSLSDGFSDFVFPAAPAPVDGPPLESPTPLTPDDKPLPALPSRSREQSDNSAGSIGNNPGAPPAQVPTIYEGPVVPAEARVLSATSIAGTPRSSGEFYSLSNHSTETLASEYVSQQPPANAAAPRPPGGHRAPPHARQKSSSLLLSPPMHGQPQQQQQQQQQQPYYHHHHHQQPHSLSQRARTAAAAAVAPETLMMGYAHIQGSFTLDGSLVDLEPFEQVKRKAVVGGQGGGVIGIETNKRDSGLLRGFGWGSLASSLGDLLGGGEMSTIKEMRDIASSKAVPLLSTPQSVLFVDLRLLPGESKTYEYTYQLPKGLPPSHRGKVMKIAYGLVIGTQRPGTAKEQRVKSIEVPFRVLGSVNSYGEILGHDLMTPYILKQDRAVVQVLSEKERSKPWATTAATGAGAGAGTNGSSSPQQLLDQATRRRRSSTATTITTSTMSGFLSYVDELLKQQEVDTAAAEDVKNNGKNGTGGGGGRGGLLSPTATAAGSRRASTASSTFLGGGGGGGGAGGWPMLSLSSREAIDLAILRSNINDAGNSSGSGNVSNNRFDIARNGLRVGTIMLARPAYRLGETVTMVIDFTNADIRCYAVHAALETAERIVDPTLALRSEASIQRVTRKVYASLSEATLYAQRFVFTATIPASATPEFITTGINLDWKIRVEFVVPDMAGGEGEQQRGGDDDSEDREGEDREREDEDREDDDGDRYSGYSARGSPLPHRPARPPPMMEEVSRDDRGGLILMAAETLRCESFEVAVPLRVYGWSGDVGGVSSERESFVA